MRVYPSFQDIPKQDEQKQTRIPTYPTSYKLSQFRAEDRSGKRDGDRAGDGEEKHLFVLEIETDLLALNGLEGSGRVSVMIDRYHQLP